MGDGGFQNGRESGSANIAAVLGVSLQDLVYSVVFNIA